MDEFRLGYLPKDSPFWDLTISLLRPIWQVPAISGDYSSTNIIMHNVQCFCENRLDDMINIRDYDKGY